MPNRPRLEKFRRVGRSGEIMNIVCLNDAK